MEFTTHVRDSEFKRTMAKLELGIEVEVEGPYARSSLLRDRSPWSSGPVASESPRQEHSGQARGYVGGSSRRRIVVVHANKSEEAMPFREELSRMEVDAPGLRVVHILSHADSTWRGHRGHIDADLMGRELSGGELWVYYASGPPGSLRE